MNSFLAKANVQWNLNRKGGHQEGVHPEGVYREFCKYCLSYLYRVYSVANANLVVKRPADEETLHHEENNFLLLGFLY